MVTRPADDRGQLLLIGALTIAIIVVGGVVLLNGMKYTDTVGSSGTASAVADSERLSAMVETDLRHLATRVDNDTDLLSFESAFRENVSQFNRYYSRAASARGSTFMNVSINASASASGWVLNQSSSDYFEDDDGDTEWTAITGANVTDPFEMTIDEWPGRAGVSGNRVELFVNVTNSGGEEWSLKFYETTGIDGNVRHIEVYNESGLRESYRSDSESWFPDSGSYEIDVLNGEINTTATSEPETDLWTFAHGVDAPYDVSMQNKFIIPGGGRPSPNLRSEGTYLIATDGSATSDVDDVSESIPVVVPAIDVYYHRPEVEYTRTIRIDDDSGGSP
jgi:hypothetical protein